MSVSAPYGSLDATGNRLTKSLRAPSLVAGTALLLMAVLSAWGNFGILENLITTGDTAKTVADISASEALFRMGVAALVAVVVLDVIVAAALFEVFESVDRGLSMMAAWFRLSYSAVFLVAICRLLEVPALLKNDGGQAVRMLDAFDATWKVGLVLFAVHLLLIGYLADRSGFMARIFGVLLTIAGLGYLADGFATILVPDFPLGFAVFVFGGEVALMFWLLIRGRQVRVPTDSSPVPGKDMP
ncbi:DUF4386 domain-containing protein [Arthrobacter sp. SAFR-044]|uniref:DUF4386 domain-containing protein n=1 Tax=Arthrobacter sp. SAFR-044 TaxID=3387278 RepID=UPI003F7C6289